MNFKSAAAYKHWLAYGHMHGVMDGSGRMPVSIKGKPHAVNHGTGHPPRKPLAQAKRGYKG